MIQELKVWLEDDVCNMNIHDNDYFCNHTVFFKPPVVNEKKNTITMYIISMDECIMPYINVMLKTRTLKGYRLRNCEPLERIKCEYVSSFKCSRKTNP